MSALEFDLAACRTLESVASCALSHARRVTNAELGNVQLIDWQVGYLKIVAQHGFPDEFLWCFQQLSEWHGTACGRALMLRRAVVIDDVREDRDFAPYRGMAERSGFRSVQSTPLLSASGALYGIVSTHGSGTGRPSDEQLRAVRDVATLAANRIVWLRSGGATR